MNWLELTQETEVDTIKELSKENPILIYKHSTRCSISGMALDRLERKWKNEEMPGIKAYYLDLLSYRPVSKKVQDTFYVQHESPQVLIIKNGRCVYHASHHEISYEEIKAFATVDSRY